MWHQNTVNNHDKLLLGIRYLAIYNLSGGKMV
jgi:hypothetical protein